MAQPPIGWLTFTERVALTHRIIGSNRLKYSFPKPVIADSALDRLTSGAHMITLPGKSYRSQMRPNKEVATSDNCVIL